MDKKSTITRLSEMAGRLRLTKMRDEMEQMLEAVSNAKLTPRETLEYFFSQEIEQREINRIEIALRGAHLPRVCTIDGFDMTAQPTLDPGVIRELRKMEWVDRAENLLFLGPPGVGKTHLAIAFGRLAIERGDSVLFISAADLITTLTKAKKDGVLAEKIALLNRPKVLIIDELGYLPFEPEAAHLLFQLVCRRYEKKSLIITSNRTIMDWGVILGDPTAATAILDRLLHHCTTVTISGDSYRLKDSLKSRLFTNP